MKTKDLFQEEPTVIMLFKKLMAGKQRVFFRNRAGKETEIRHLSIGVSTSGKPAWWFYHEPNTGTNQPVTWKTGDAINKLSIKKDGDRWVMFDRTVKLKESQDPSYVRFLLVSKLIDAGKTVRLHYVRKSKNFHAFIGGIISDIVQLGESDPHRYAISFTGEGVNTSLSSTETFKDTELAAMFLYKTASGSYVLSDRPAGEDDDL